MMGSERGKRIKAAVGQANQRIRKAAAQLADLDVTEGEIRALVEGKVAARLKPMG